MSEFKTTIGLEIHVQLKTKSKMFCGCDNQSYAKASTLRQGYGSDAADGKFADAEPNTLVCPVCLGMPGTLPVTNRVAIEWTVMTGLAFGSDVTTESKFDRKHYFYPDLPKGFQISQYDKPFCRGGEVEVDGRKIRLNRIHLEEDAGKLIHPSRERAETGPSGKNYSLVDLNRAGTPLMEIVTEPDLASPTEAKKFMEELQLAIRYLKVSDADMEKGQLRCDANISLSLKSKVESRKSLMSPIVEIKNLNSFKFVEQALIYEEKRLADDFKNWPEKKTKITRGFNSEKGITYEQRRKEEAADYRYFPEPDIPPIKLSEETINGLRLKIKELPKQKHERYIKAGIREDVADKIIRQPHLVEYLESAKELEKDLATFVVEQVKVGEINRVAIGDLAELMNFVKEGMISKTVAKEIYSEMVRSGKKAAEIIKERGLEQVSDENELKTVVAEVVKENSGLEEKYRSGKIQIIGFFVGQAMKKTAGRANPQLLTKLFKEYLSGDNSKSN